MLVAQGACATGRSQPEAEAFLALDGPGSPRGACQLPEFMRHLNRNLAKVMNQHAKYWGQLFDGRSYEHFEHADSQSILETIGYILGQSHRRTRQ